MTREEMKTLTALLTGLAGVATAVGSCNRSAQERLQADNKIYTTLAEGQTKQSVELTELRRQLDEMRGYLQAQRAALPPPMANDAATLGSGSGVAVPGTLRVLGSRRPLPVAASAPLLRPLPELPAAPAPAPKMRPLPKFESL